MNARDSALISSLYLAEASNMRAFAKRRLNDPDEADDLVNEAFRILSERDDLHEIHNPAAFLMTVLHRQIDSHLRKKYRRKHMSIEEAEMHVLSSPDIAESYEEKEQAALVAESMKELRSARQKRAVNLYSLNYKASEIAAMETAAGQPTTSHQISCVLQGGLANLKAQFRRRGLLPSFIPIPWFLRLRERISVRAHSLTDHFRFVDAAAAIQIVVIVSVATLFNGGVPPRAPAPTAVSPPVSGEVDFGLAALSLPSRGIPDPSTLVPVDQAPRSPTDAAQTRPTDSSVSTAEPVTNPPTTPTVIPFHMQPAPRAEVSKQENGPQGHVEVTPYDVHTLDYNVSEHRGRQAPPISDQAVDLVDEPTNIPTPECGGLPPICNDDPPPEYR